MYFVGNKVTTTTTTQSRNVDVWEYKQDMSVILYHVGEIFDDIDD